MNRDKSQKDYIIKNFPKVRFNEPLSHYTSWKVGGKAKYFFYIDNIKKLKNLIQFLKRYHINYFVLGKGTNILISDNIWNGAVIKLTGDFEKIQFQSNTVIAGSSVTIPNIIKETVKRSLSGIETLSGIPGTLGGAIITNAGTKYGCIGNVVRKIEVIDYSGDIKYLFSNQLRFKYRQSVISKRYIITKIFLHLKKKNKHLINEKINKILQERKSQPTLKRKNAGCVFKNPEGNKTAGFYIEQCGLKGKRIGKAYISKKHCNFIIAPFGAKAKDIWKLIKYIQKKVKKKFNIDLDLEIKTIGTFGEEKVKT